MTVGERLRKARKKLKKTQAAIAAELDVKQPAVAQWETGAGSFEPHRIRDVAKAYGVDPLLLLPTPTKRKARGAA